MPTFGHVFYGLCLLMPILYYTKDEDKFSYKVAFIFLANNIFGPDCVALFFITPFHSILGFLILAIPLSLVFSYSSRFSLVKSNKFFPLKFVDDEIREVNWKNAYFVTAAGGFSHFFIDQFYHREREMHVWPEVDISHDEMLAWSGEAYHFISPLILIGFLIVVTTIILSMYYFNKGNKETFKIFLIATALSIFLMAMVSTAVFNAEREYAVIVGSLVYVLIPLFLLMYAARDVRDNPITTPDIPKIQRKTLIYIIAMISISLALFLLYYAYYALTRTESLATFMAEDGDQSVNEIAAAITIIAYITGTVALILLIGSIGLFFKSNICRYLVIATSLCFFVFSFPLAIALSLNEKEIKALFGKESD